MRQRHIGVRSLALGVALASLAGVPAIASQPGPTAQAPDEARPGPIARAVGALFRPATPRLRADGTAPLEPATDAKPTGSGVPARRQDQSGQVTSGNAFNPAISLIPDLAYYRDSRAGEGIGLLGRADGFGRGDNQGQSSTGGLSPGFNLRELEIALSGTVDPYFDAVANLSVAKGAIEAEELYLRTRRFPAGLQLKAGRFLSDIGYINRQHPHQWALADQNLAYDLLLDGSLGDTGVQVTWLPALPIYLQVGAEALQGDNAAMAAHVGPDADHPHFSEMAGPRVLTGFAKISPNLGYDHALQVGTSVVGARQHQEETSDGALEGQAWLFGLDAVYKFDSPKPSGAGDLVVQAEYLRRRKSLTVVAAAIPEDLGAPRTFTQDGFYVQATYGVGPRWTASLRLDAAGLTNRLEAGARLLADDGMSHRVSGGIAFDPTDFSRLRFQVERTSILVGGVRESFTQLFVQLQASLGVHGAHKF